MKKIGTFFALLLMLVLVCPAGVRAAGNMQVVVEGNKTKVAAGETVDFTVKLTNVDGVITNMQFNLDIPAGMEYVSGGVVSGNGFEGLEAFNPNKDFQYAMVANGQSNEGDVELLTFTCKASGYGDVSVGIVDDDTFKVETNGKGYEVSIASATINITAGSGSADTTDSKDSKENGTSANSADGDSDASSETSEEFEVSIEGGIEGDGEAVSVKDALKEQKEKEKAEETAEDNTIFWVVMGVLGVLIVIVVILIIKKMPKKEKRGNSIEK